jgi:hypothetical protein
MCRRIHNFDDISLHSASCFSVRGNQNKDFMFNNFVFFYRALYEIMWKNIVVLGRPQMTIWRMRVACCIPKAIDTHSEYVILTAFPLQQWAHQSASMLRYSYLCRYIYGLLPAIFYIEDVVLWFFPRPRRN